MGDDEKLWIDGALDVITKAERMGLSCLIVRRNDENGEADIAFTNVKDAALVKALRQGLTGTCRREDED